MAGEEDDLGPCGWLADDDLDACGWQVSLIEAPPEEDLLTCGWQAPNATSLPASQRDEHSISEGMPPMMQGTMFAQPGALAAQVVGELPIASGPAPIRAEHLELLPCVASDMASLCSDQPHDRAIHEAAKRPGIHARVDPDALANMVDHSMQGENLTGSYRPGSHLTGVNRRDLATRVSFLASSYLSVTASCWRWLFEMVLKERCVAGGVLYYPPRV